MTDSTKPHDEGRRKGAGLQRRTPLRANPEKVREWKERSRKPIGSNPARIRKLRDKQFGTDGKREWIMGLPSALSGKPGNGGEPIDPAHVLKTRGAGGGPEGLAPLLRHEHTDFDGSMTDERFAERYGGRTREDVRDAARRLEEEWQRRKGELIE